MERGQYASIQAGTFLLLEKLRVLALRRLVKRCQLVHAALEPAKQSQLPLSAPLKPMWVLCAGLWVWLQHLGRARLRMHGVVLVARHICGSCGVPLGTSWVQLQCGVHSTQQAWVRCSRHELRPLLV